MTNTRAPSRAFAVGAALAAALTVIAEPAGTLDLPPLPGPAPRALPATVAGIGAPTSARCAGCHKEIAEEWRRSLHHRAWNNEYFLRAYELEPLAFCRKCHAPGADPKAEPPAEARDDGVGCAACHGVPGGVVGVHSAKMREGGHEVMGDARLATPAGCGGCHQFALPGPPGFDAGPMQNTLGEHQRSAQREKSCQSCHMPLVPSHAASGPEAEGGSHRSHSFQVQGDRSMMAQAIVVKSAELRKGEVRIEIAPGAIGHAFPTGDLHRQAEVRVAPIDGSGRELTTGSSEVLRRTFGSTRAGPGTLVRVQSSDNRLSEPRVITLRVPPETRRARWKIVWQRLPPELAARFGMKMSDNEMVALEGVVTR